MPDGCFLSDWRRRAGVASTVACWEVGGRTAWGELEMTNASGTTESSQPAAARRQRPRSWRGTLWRWTRAVTVGYLILVLFMMWFETQLIFPTWQIPPGDWNPAGVEFEDVVFDSEDGTRLHGWYFEHPAPRAHVLYSHGNGENLAHLGEYMDGLREEYGVSIFAYDYRGYGKSDGKPDEPGILRDGRAAQRHLAQRAGIATEQVVHWGRSIGGAVAVQLAADVGARGIILERTFTSLPDVAARHYPWLPVRRLMRNQFNSLARIGEFRGPLLQSHGTHDEIVPFVLGKQLFDAAASERKQFVPMPGVTHNGPNTKDYYTELHLFFEQLR